MIFLIYIVNYISIILDWIWFYEYEIWFLENQLTALKNSDLEFYPRTLYI